jgi:hypothetical protein
MVEEIVRKRPSNILAFIHEYSLRLMGNFPFIQPTVTIADSIRTKTRNRKKRRRSTCAPTRRRKRRRLKKEEADRESALRYSESLTKRQTILPKLLPKTPLLRMRSKDSSRSPFSSNP